MDEDKTIITTTDQTKSLSLKSLAPPFDKTFTSRAVSFF
ncbi:hypothetical protein COLO4_30517 [Corchorus olitorius]|uniref:Uncharacterized protein n=1 Tax=Corchorus olitorius TaxID=93759 RepID=A0A1R3H8B6_9ROSI|nr:hypothetical protein COLO4_30517 [Corchorus olitorius]